MFFVKQKTAYEMRMSDGSSDVCSSDLPELRLAVGQRRELARRRAPERVRRLVHGARILAVAHVGRELDFVVAVSELECGPCGLGGARQGGHEQQCGQPCKHPFAAHSLVPWRPHPRSEEHTSELQSLMRTSYAVFCLQKKKTT